ncbi:MAG: type II toxin-antitoxin system toxin ribonuclease C26 [Acidimicrobiales bacterium]
MTLIVDAAPLVAVADRRDPMRERVQAVLAGEAGELVVPSPISAEVDYLLGTRLGRAARLAFLDDVASGVFTVACLDADDYRLVAALDRQYDTLDAGLADLSAVVLATRYRTSRILTFDERHFRTLRPLGGGHFTLLPADEATQ